MRSISLRRFRDTIADIDEPTEVVRRDPTGNLQIIGTWTPSLVYPKTTEVRALAAMVAEDPRFDGTPVRYAVPDTTGMSGGPAERYDIRPIRPVPKKGK